MARWLTSQVSFLFGFHERVTRKPYAIAGLTLIVVKYVVDTLLIWGATGTVWKPWNYVYPPALPNASDSPFLHGFPTTLALVLLIWSIPFLWIGVSMTIRRAADAGWSPWVGVLFFLPLVNYFVMFTLCVAPSSPHSQWNTTFAVETGQHHFRSVMFGVLTAVAVGLLGLVMNVFFEASYGMSLFFATPVVLGIASGFVFNRKSLQSAAATNGVVTLGVLIVGGVLLSFALEGLMCLLMAFPIALLLAILGGAFGRILAIQKGPQFRGATMGILIIPASAAIDHVRARTEPEPTYLATTTIIVDAPRDIVWQHVIQFGEIQGDLSLPFRLGLAYPLRARIAGQGVGAIRRCEFSTGAFVEPITVWDQPSRLAFDVTAQPVPLREWSPYQHVYAPHLNGYFRSVRGEFRLTALPGGRTKLEGRTWYQLDVHPRDYWRFVSEAIITRIHQRVLDQVARESVAAKNLHQQERLATL